ncbi:MAG TPA: SelB C-terminal domain-containing protein [Kineosporiaceae bacterium]|nr:SelB C-terminal domain-containing protein [Kineosporiaceae bacterium]
MHVVATAGHVDHGKSTLVRALTGMEPDRHEEERRRGMTIDLGFAWTTLPGGEVVAFVDVPGHERFVPTMLAGVGPVPAVLLVVAADEGWMPQTAEHVAALDALGVRHALLVVTRSDLADPGPTAADVRARLAGTSLAGPPAVAVSARTGAGLGVLAQALGTLVRALPRPDVDVPVRLWTDRSFTIRGSGTVVTGTLSAGTLCVGDRLTVLHGGGSADRRVGRRPVVVRGLQTLGRPAERVPAVARVAVNLRGVERDDVERGDVLAVPGAVDLTPAVDARLDLSGGSEPERLPAHALLHIGSAATAVIVRPLDAPPGRAHDRRTPVDAVAGPGQAADGGPQARAVRFARLTLRRPLPLLPADVALLRDPGAHRIVARVTVLDTSPPPLRMRGAARARALELARLHAGGTVDATAVLRARGVLHRGWLRSTGAAAPEKALVAGDWLVDPDAAARWRARLAESVVARRPTAGVEPGLPLAQARAELGLPDEAVVVALATPPLAVRGGRIIDAAVGPDLPGPILVAVRALADDLAVDPFAAPSAVRLMELGLGRRELAAADRAGAVLRVADGVVLMADAVERAADVLSGLAQPFTVSEARRALRTSRRVAVPLLELLDRRRVTRRLPDDRRVLVAGLPPGRDRGDNAGC